MGAILSPFSSGVGLEPYQFNVPRAGGGSNDAPALKTALAAAIAYALANQGYAEVLTLDAAGKYLMNDAPTIGGTFNGNAIIPLLPQSVTAVKPVIRFVGASQNAPAHWLQQVPQQTGTVWATTRTDGTLDGTYGPASIMGGPWHGYGGANSATFSNLQPIIDGITTAPPYPSTYGGFNFFGQGQASVPNGAHVPLGVVPNGTGFTQYVSGGSGADGYTCGLIMPDAGNNDRCDIGQYTVYGAAVGLVGSEHCTFDSLRTLYCGFGLMARNTLGGSAPGHGIAGRYFSCESTAVPIATLASGFLATDAPIGVNILQMDVEVFSGGVMASDANSYLGGQVSFNVPSGPIYANYLSGANRFRLVQENIGPGKPPAGIAPAVPLTTVAFPNYYWRDATVYLTSGGAAVSAITVTDPPGNVITTGQTLGASGTVNVQVPSGHSITLTYAGAAPTWIWDLH